MKAKLICAALSWSALACIGPFSENVEHHYQDLASARAAGAVGDGRWIPPILPEDASDIREVHNIDSNRTWCCFATVSVADVRAKVSERGGAKVRGPIHAGPREMLRDFSWWPASMVSASVEPFEFHEAPAYPGATPMRVHVGIDSAGKVCFHRGF